jgi:hypothetical protein
MFKESVDMPWLKSPAIRIPHTDLPKQDADDYESDPELIARESKRMLEDLRTSIMKFTSSETPNKLVSNLTGDLKELRLKRNTVVKHPNEQTKKKC